MSARGVPSRIGRQAPVARRHYIAAEGMNSQDTSLHVQELPWAPRVSGSMRRHVPLIAKRKEALLGVMARFEIVYPPRELHLAQPSANVLDTTRLTLPRLRKIPGPTSLSLEFMPGPSSTERKLPTRRPGFGWQSCLGSPGWPCPIQAFVE